MSVKICADFIYTCIYAYIPVCVHIYAYIYEGLDIMQFWGTWVLVLKHNFSLCMNIIWLLCLQKIFLNLFLQSFFKRLYLFFLFLDREEGRERGKHQCVVASHVPHTGELACNPGMCPDWELIQQPFGSQASAQSTEPHQLGLKINKYIFLNCTYTLILWYNWKV